MTSRPLADVRARRGTLPTIVATTIALVVGIIAGPSVATAAVAEAPTPVTSRSDGIAASGVVKAADMSQFRPGNIISDAVFYNGNGMSEGQVQDFLNSQVPTCRSGYVCLKNKTDQTRQIAADPMCSAYRGGGVESAARIITKVGQACGINPQVLIVMLQKEQGLVTDTYPYDSQYRIAMGQGCPDTSGCDSAYYGFFNQVYGAARQLKRYENPPGTSNFFTWYAPGRTWSILYHPPALVNGQWVDQCGSSPVYIENKATSALYYYTPYQPNAASLRAGSGEGDRCSSYGNRNFYRFFNDWFGPSTTVGNPFGYVDSVQPLVGGARFRGWVADPDTSAPAQVHIYIGSTGHAITAADNRPDVAAAYPQLGAGHGFDVVLPVPPGATTRVCAYAINVAGPGTNTLVECRDVTPLSGDPVGSWDSLSAVEGGFRLRGWGADPDSLASLSVRVRVDGRDQTIRADKARADLARVMVAHGVNRSYDTVIPATPGRHTVCLTSINIGPGSNVDLGCRTVTVAPLPERGRLPIGSVDDVKIEGTRLTVRGWAIDPDTASPIDVHIYVDGKGTVARASRDRPDVGNAYGSYGPAHGFQVQQTVAEGAHDVCVYAINTVGDNPLLGCRTIVATSFEPRGYLDSVDVVPGGVRVRGWAIDDDVPSASLDVHVYVGSRGTALSADRPRSDVAAAFPLAGGRHGFDSVVAAPAGVQQVCAYAINVPSGANPLLGCTTVTVP